MPKELYNPKSTFVFDAETPPRVFASPQRYIQGAGVVDRSGHYIQQVMKVTRAGILASARGHNSEGDRVATSLNSCSMSHLRMVFEGECSSFEIEKHVASMRSERIDCLIAVGGGKVADAGKCIAHRLDVPVVIVSSLASTDAPCSALSVVYTPHGTTDHVEFFPKNPDIIIVDTDIIANAPERHLVAGMGDAMATWYEASVCLNNPSARNAHGALPTLASCAIGEICARTLFDYGELAAKAVRRNENNEALDRVVEANTLLSGIGFESGGLALAHALAVAFPAIKVVHDNYLHGEMVSMGTMAQLSILESDDQEKVARFFARVGLPINLEQISLSRQNHSDLDILVETALTRPPAWNMPREMNHKVVLEAILDADSLGRVIAREIGDEAYKRLRK